MMPGHPMYFGATPDEVATEELTAHAGKPLPDGQRVAGKDEIVEALRSVYDPEIPVNLYDLGLIYDLAVAENGNVEIMMTLTAPACPVAGEMPKMVAEAVSGVEGTGEITVQLTWDPPWTQDKMSEDAKLALGLM